MVDTLLNNKLNEWAGTKGIDYINDISACFKWLVPKLTRYDLWCDVGWNGTSKVQGKQHFALVQLEEQTEVVAEKTTVLALCLAIHKLIDAGKEDVE